MLHATSTRPADGLFPYPESWHARRVLPNPSGHRRPDRDEHHARREVAACADGPAKPRTQFEVGQLYSGADGSSVWALDRSAGRSLLLDFSQQDRQFKFLIRDQDSKFTAAFDDIFAGNCTSVIKDAGPVAASELICRAVHGAHFAASAWTTS